MIFVTARKAKSRNEDIFLSREYVSKIYKIAKERTHIIQHMIERLCEKDPQGFFRHECEIKNVRKFT